MSLRHRVLTVLAGATLAAALAGCGGSGDDVQVTDPGAGGSPSASAPAGTELAITYDDGAGKTDDWTLTCDEAGAASGTHPNPDQACAALTENGAKALPAVGTDMMCTQQFGGPQKATITGSFNGKPVDSQLSRGNGCEISRWDDLEGLLPKTAGAAAEAPQ